MAPGGPGGTVGSAAPSHFRTICFVQEAAKKGGGATSAAAAAQTREVVCRKCRQSRMVPAKPAPFVGQIAAKLAKGVVRAEEARLRREEIVEDKAFMRRHSVGDTVARRAHPRPPNSC